MDSDSAHEVIRFLLAVADADGTRDSGEVRLVDKVGEALGLSDDVRQALAQSRSSWEPKCLASLGLDPADSRLVISLGLQVAHADGQYSAAERELIARSAGHLGLGEHVLLVVEQEVANEAAARR